MELIAIISQSYQVFDYPKPLKINNVCTDICCMDENSSRLLLTKPLKEITVDLINGYNDNAQAVNYDINEFKYFLPRYLELIADFEFPSAIDISLSLKNLNLDKGVFWENSIEVDCINTFAKLFFKKCLHTTSFYKDGNLMDVINMFYKAGVDINELLQIWLSDLCNFSIVHLEDLVSNNFNQRGKMKSSSFIDFDLSSIIENWILENKAIIMYAIESHIMISSFEEFQLQKLSYLYDSIKYL